MTIAKLTIAGKIHGVKHRMAGETPVCEVSVCKKRYAKQGEEPSYDWFRINIWGKLPDFLAAKLAKDNHIAACGDFGTRDWTDKEGNKKVQMEVKCQSFDVEVEGVAQETAPPAEPPKPKRPAAPTADPPDEPPF